MFLKFPSIFNHYMTKDLKWWMDRDETIENDRYVVLEKIHGSNCQLIFQRGLPYIVASRNQIIPDDESFHGVKDVLKKYKDELDCFQRFIDIMPYQVVRVYGELFGSNIQKGVNYGKEKQFRIFAITTDNRFLPWVEVEEILENMEISHMAAPVLGYCNGLKEALEFDVKRNTTLYETDEVNIMEGGVIQPYEEVRQSEQGSIFMIKKKNKEFEEKKSEKSKTTFPKESSWRVEVNKSKEDFMGYIHEERIQSVFSKYGVITKSEQIGEYMKYIIDDALDTFEREEGFDKTKFDKNELRYILNCGKVIMEYLKKEL